MRRTLDIPPAIVLYVALALGAFVYASVGFRPWIPANPALLFCAAGAVMIVASKEKKRWYWATATFTLIAMFAPIFMGMAFLERATFLDRQVYYILPDVLLVLLVASRRLRRYAGDPSLREAWAFLRSPGT